MTIKMNELTADKTIRFRINPVEVVIFMAVSMVFLNSAYSLFYDREGGFQPAALAPMAATPTSEARAIASVSKAFDNINLSCEMSSAEPGTSAPRVRLAGKLCGDTVLSAGGPAKLLKTQIVNQSNKSVAVVFTDVSKGTFSTDYIPLNTGRNSIHVEFVYENGRQSTQDIVVNRN